MASYSFLLLRCQTAFCLSHFLDWKLDLNESVVKILSSTQANLAAWSNDGVGIVFYPGSQRLIGR